MEMTSAPVAALRAGWAQVRRWQVRRLGDQPQWRRVAAGFWMRIDPAHTMDLAYYFGVYEPALVRLIAALVRPGETAVDVGTHKGYVTLLLARAVGPAGRVLAVDADHRAFAEMAENCRRNGFPQVRPVLCAVGDRPGSCRFALTSAAGNSSRFPNQVAAAAVETVVEVEQQPLDALLAAGGIAHESVSFVKMDCEGSEPLALAGMPRVLAARPALYMEINRASLAAGGFTAASIEAPLRAAGYHIYSVSWRRSLLRRVQVALAPVADLQSVADDCCEVVAVHPGHPAAARLAPFLGRS